MAVAHTRTPATRASSTRLGARRVAVARPVRRAASAGRRAAVTRCAASSGEVQQQLQDAEERWQTQVMDGTVKTVSTREVGELMKDGWVLLDVRPPTEVDKVAINGAVTVPLFVPDTSNSVGSLMARLSAWGTGGWWLGGTHMVSNTNFLPEVQSKIPKDAKVIVGCQKGLRSLAACEQLSRAGYQTVVWVNGGFDVAQPGDLPTDKDIRYAGIGGVSEILGWTEVQQAENKAALGGLENVLKLVAVFLAIDLGLFAWEYIAYLQGQPNPLDNLLQ